MPIAFAFGDRLANRNNATLKEVFLTLDKAMCERRALLADEASL